MTWASRSVARTKFLIFDRSGHDRSHAQDSLFPIPVSSVRPGENPSYKEGEL